jgi:hypothetical protein
MPTGNVVVQVGGTPISKTLYQHWMRIGAATVELPVPGQPPPKPVAYNPPGFSDCVVHLRTDSPRSNPNTPPTDRQLKTRCAQIYASIRARILAFLITGYWLRNEAIDRGVSFSEAEVRKKFEEERQAQYPTAAAFQTLLTASHQTIHDLLFAVKTRMLSTKLLERFTETHANEMSPQTGVGAFNRALEQKWVRLTSCRSGYIVKDCLQYKSLVLNHWKPRGL